MRLGRLTADATIVFDGDVGIARNRLPARPGCGPDALIPLARPVFAMRRYALGPATEAALPLIR